MKEHPAGEKTEQGKYSKGENKNRDGKKGYYFASGFFLKNTEEDSLPPKLANYPLLSCNPLFHKDFIISCTEKINKKV